MKELTSTRFTANPFFIVMMFSASWALQIFITKLGFNAGAQVLVFQIISILIALLVLVIVLNPKYGKNLRELYITQPSFFWKLFIANGIQSGLGTWLSIIGISLTATINAGFLVKLTTVTTVIFAWLILNERLSLTKILMVLIMLIGAYLLTTKGEMLLPKVGDLYILAACVCWSLGNVLLRKYLLSQSLDIELITLQRPISILPVALILVGFVLWSPNSIFGEILKTPGVSMPLISYLYAIGNGIILALTWTFLNQTLKVTTASYMTMMSMATPIIVSILAMIFLHETMVLIQYLGAGLIILAGVVTYSSDIGSV